MVIDGHAHSCGVYSTSKSVINYLNEHNIDKVILCGGERNSTKDYSYPMMSKLFKGDKLGYFFNKIICKVVKKNNIAENIDEENKAVYKMSKESPDRILNAYWINPNEEDCIKKMESFYEEYGFYLIKMHQCWTNFDIDDDRFISIMKWAKEHDKVCFIHLLTQEQVKKFITFANDNPENIIITAHMIGSLEMEKSLNRSNVYFDLSAPQLYSNRTLKRNIKKFGIEKFLAGSDTPYGKNNFIIVQKRLIEIGLDRRKVEDICGNNIVRILKL